MGGGAPACSSHEVWSQGLPSSIFVSFLSIQVLIIAWHIFQDAKKARKTEEYDYVMDEEIAFVQALKMPGTKNKRVSSYVLIQGDLFERLSDDKATSVLLAHAISYDEST